MLSIMEQLVFHGYLSGKGVACNVNDTLESRTFCIVVATLPVVLAKAAAWNEALALGECTNRHSKRESTS